LSKFSIVALTTAQWILIGVILIELFSNCHCSSKINLIVSWQNWWFALFGHGAMVTDIIEFKNQYISLREQRDVIRLASLQINK